MAIDVARPANTYDVFISYSRKDIEFARKLESALESYAPTADLGLPHRHLEVFRDEEDFTGTEYFQSVEKHLTQASKLVVLCSPHARASAFVNDEIRRFATCRGAANVITLLLSGVPNNEAAPDQESDKAFPQALYECMEMPRAISYAGFDVPRQKIDKGMFSGSWYSILAEVYDLSRGVIEQRERKRQVRRRNVTAGIVSGVVTALSAALVWALVSRREAVQQRNIALSRQLAAQAELMLDRDPHLIERAVQLAAESMKRFPSIEADQLLRRGISLLPKVISDLPHSDAVTGVSLSPDGKQTVTVSDGAARVWETESAREIGRLAEGGIVLIAAVSPDGGYVATGGVDKTVRIFDASSRHEIAHAVMDAQVTTLVFHPKGNYLAARCSGSVVYLWHVPEWQQVQRLVHDDLVVSIALSPDGTHLYTGTRKGEVWAWHLPGGNLRTKFAVHGPVYGIAVTTGELVAVADGTNDVSVWKDGTRIATLHLEGPVRAVSFNGDGKLLAGAAGNQVQIWKTDSWREYRKFQHTDLIEGLLFHPRDQLLATAGQDRTARLWDLASGLEVARIGHQEPVMDLSFNRDGSYFATASTDKTVRVVAISPEQARYPWEGRRSTAIGWTPSGRYLATGDRDGMVRVWDVAARRQVTELPPADGDEVSALAFSLDERLLAIAGWRGGVRVIEWLSGKQVRQVQHGGRVKALAFRPDSHLFATGGTDHTVKLWDLDAEDSKTIEQADEVNGLAFSRNKPLLAVVTGSFERKHRNSVAVWDIVSHVKVMNIEGLEAPLESVAFGPDEREIVTGGQDFRATVWNVQSGREILRLPHELVVWSAALSPDGHYLATGSEDGSARIWERSAQREIVRLAHPGAVRRVGFTADGRRLFSTSFDKSGVLIECRSWFWQPEDLIRDACHLIARMSEKDWHQYLSDEMYKPVCTGRLAASRSSDPR
jgi:WD40 repeat protein